VTGCLSAQVRNCPLAGAHSQSPPLTPTPSPHDDYHEKGVRALHTVYAAQGRAAHAPPSPPTMSRLSGPCTLCMQPKEGLPMPPSHPPHHEQAVRPLQAVHAAQGRTAHAPPSPTMSRLSGPCMPPRAPCLGARSTQHRADRTPWWSRMVCGHVGRWGGMRQGRQQGGAWGEQFTAPPAAAPGGPHPLVVQCGVRPRGKAGWDEAGEAAGRCVG